LTALILAGIRRAALFCRCLRLVVPAQGVQLPQNYRFSIFEPISVLTLHELENILWRVFYYEVVSFMCRLQLAGFISVEEGKIIRALNPDSRTIKPPVVTATGAIR